MPLKLKPESECRWDIVSLGEVMLRFDPGDDRIHTARSFRVWEGGGEYNVARNLANCFGRRAAVVTALADNEIGRLVEGLIRQGGVDVSQISWRETDAISRSVRNGIYFMERGFGLQRPVGCSDRGNTAVSQLKAGDIDWGDIFSSDGARWFHTGGIFAALSETTAAVAAEAMQAARSAGAIVSYDLNYRDSLWSERGGREAANELNRELLRYADVVFGVENFWPGLGEYSEASFRTAVDKMSKATPNLQMFVTVLRDVHSASRHSLSGVCFSEGAITKSRDYPNIDVLDRVGSGDAFAAGMVYGILEEQSMQTALDLATASAALALACAGDGLCASLDEVHRLASAAHHDAIR